MGLPPDRCKRVDDPPPRPATGPIPGTALLIEVNHFWRI
jgi:hypothetical protein